MSVGVVFILLLTAPKTTNMTTYILVSMINEYGCGFHTITHCTKDYKNDQLVAMTLICIKEKGFGPFN